MDASTKTAAMHDGYPESQAQQWEIWELSHLWKFPWAILSPVHTKHFRVDFVRPDVSVARGIRGKYVKMLDIPKSRRKNGLASKPAFKN